MNARCVGWWLALVGCSSGLVLQPLARAGEEGAEGADAPAAAQAGVYLELGLKSAFMFRGVNLFSSKEAVAAQRPVANPLVSWSVFDTGLSLTYFGGFQLDRADRRFNRDNGLDLEQDLILGYTLALPAGFSLQAAFTWIFWPFADEGIMGTSLPSVVEPLVGVTWSGPLDAGLRVSYYHGVPDSLEFLRHAYLNPWVARRFELAPGLAAVQLGLGLGVKLWVDGRQENMVDVLASIELPIELPHGHVLRPGVFWSWTNLEEAEDGRELGFRDEFCAWFGLALGNAL